MPAAIPALPRPSRSDLSAPAEARRQRPSPARAGGRAAPAAWRIRTPGLARRCLEGLLLAGLLALAGCGKAPESAAPAAAGEGGPEVASLRYQGTVGVVTFPELAEALGYLEPLKLEWIGNTISGPQDIQTAVTGDVAFGTAFNGAIVKLVAAGAPIQAVVGSYGIDEQTWGGFYVLEDSPIRGARDLIGKKVSVNTLGAHSEFVLREYLLRNGLTPQEARSVEMIVVPPVNSEQTLRQGQIEVATLGGILRDKALERGGLRLLFSDHQLYGNFTAGSYVFRRDFIERHPQAVQRFVEGVARAIEWARTTPRDEVRARYTGIIQARKRTEDASLVQYWLSTGIAEPGGQIAPREFDIWIDWLQRAGELPPGGFKADDLYSNRFNPYARPAAGEAATSGPAS